MIMDTFIHIRVYMIFAVIVVCSSQKKTTFAGNVKTTEIDKTSSKCEFDCKASGHICCQLSNGMQECRKDHNCPKLVTHMVKLADKVVKSTKAPKEVLTTEKAMTMDIEERQESQATEDVSAEEVTPTAVPLTSEVESSSTTSTSISSATSATEKIVTTQQVLTSPPTTTTTIDPMQENCSKMSTENCIEDKSCEWLNDKCITRNKLKELFVEECNVVTWHDYLDAQSDESKPAYSEEEVGITKYPWRCYEKVKNHKSEKQTKEPNGMTLVGEDGSKKCYAKYNATHVTDWCNKTCKTCIFGDPNPYFIKDTRSKGIAKFESQSGYLIVLINFITFYFCNLL